MVERAGAPARRRSSGSGSSTTPTDRQTRGGARGFLPASIAGPALFDVLTRARVGSLRKSGQLDDRGKGLPHLFAADRAVKLLHRDVAVAADGAGDKVVDAGEP